MIVPAVSCPVNVLEPPCVSLADKYDLIAFCVEIILLELATNVGSVLN
jgi:hypothetical protein